MGVLRQRSHRGITIPDGAKFLLFRKEFVEAKGGCCAWARPGVQQPPAEARSGLELRRARLIDHRESCADLACALILTRAILQATAPAMGMQASASAVAWRMNGLDSIAGRCPLIVE